MGVGIAYPDQKNLFDPFGKPGKGTSGEEGTGLGLSICREFCEKQGGRIRFESTPGQGTTFYVELRSVENIAV